MNRLQEKVALETRSAPEIGRPVHVAFAKESAEAEFRSQEFRSLNPGRLQAKSAELLYQGALIASFFGGSW